MLYLYSDKLRYDYFKEKINKCEIYKFNETSREKSRNAHFHRNIRRQHSQQTSTYSDDQTSNEIKMFISDLDEVIHDVSEPIFKTWEDHKG